MHYLGTLDIYSVQHVGNGPWHQTLRFGTLIFDKHLTVTYEYEYNKPGITKFNTGAHTARASDGFYYFDWGGLARGGDCCGIAISFFGKHHRVGFGHFTCNCTLLGPNSQNKCVLIHIRKRQLQSNSRGQMRMEKSRIYQILVVSRDILVGLRHSPFSSDSFHIVKRSWYRVIVESLQYNYDMDV